MQCLDGIGIGSVCLTLHTIVDFRLIIAYRKGQIDERFQDYYSRLLDIRNQLERLSMTQAWSLRETDLFQFQRKLDRIDEARVNGNFIDADGQPADLHAQRVSNWLVQF
jgi:hypothetical protein